MKKTSARIIVVGGLNTVHQAARPAVYAGTLQFHRAGIQPVRSDELEGVHG